VVALERSADEIRAVRIDGAPVSWSLGADGEAVELAGRLPSARSRVEIEYRPRRPGVPSRTPAEARPTMEPVVAPWRASSATPSRTR
jgi:hypothetical protein